MSDVVVTVPIYGWADWLAEGDCAGEPATGREYIFSVGGRPSIESGERVYIVAHGRLRGYAPLVRLEERQFSGSHKGCVLVRGGGAVAVTIARGIRGFRGFRYRWWDRTEEQRFPDWKGRDALVVGR